MHDAHSFMNLYEGNVTHAFVEDCIFESRALARVGASTLRHATRELPHIRLAHPRILELSASAVRKDLPIEL
jgi:hypothetical protein